MGPKGYPHPGDNRRSYSDGRLSKDDDGDLTISVGSDKGRVVLEFGKPIKWLAWPPEQAIEFAKELERKARCVQATGGL